MRGATFSRIIMYVRDMPKVAAFYEQHFGFEVKPGGTGEDIRLTPSGGGCEVLLLQASKGHRTGQSIIKLVFDVEDVEAFKEERAKAGLKFGKTWKGEGYSFANARDPAKNLVQISERRLAGR